MGDVPLLPHWPAWIVMISLSEKVQFIFSDPQAFVFTSAFLGFLETLWVAGVFVHGFIPRWQKHVGRERVCAGKRLWHIPLRLDF